jgi:type IV pilus assembly protein PilB
VSPENAPLSRKNPAPTPEPPPSEPAPSEPTPLPGPRFVPSDRPLGEVVVDLLEATGLLPPDQVPRLREAARSDSVVQVLVDLGLASGEAIARILAARHHLPLVELGLTGIDPAASASVPLHVLERVRAIPYAFEGETLCVAVADPGNVHGIDEIKIASRKPIALGVAAEAGIDAELAKLVRSAEAFGTRASVADQAELELTVEDDDVDDLEADDGISDVPLVRLVNSVLFDAAEAGASDVHFEPGRETLAVRFRIDGVLHEMQRIPRAMAPGVVTRLKVLAKLDIAERRKPQDGRISLGAAAAGRMLDVRVATLPTVEGESVVLRLLDKSKRPPTLQELGLSEEMQERLSALISRPTGALLVTGPTGSGKSTSLFAALSEIHRSDINIITVEDPVEYRLPGVSQVQINVKAGLTFATVLRSIVRADPDVIMVGEIRDVETAKISIEAALTGHFVFSTLHTNDAPGAITRLNEMGVEPFLTGAAVTGVLAQRLARRLCEDCREQYAPSEEDLLNARVSPDALDGRHFYRKGGCARCRQTGYRGRIGVFQLLEMSERLEELAVAKSSRDELERAALAEGMRSLWDDGVTKVMAGLTSIEELARVTV